MIREEYPGLLEDPILSCEPLKPNNLSQLHLEGDVTVDHPLEEDMATHSNILAWRIPWTKERGDDGLLLGRHLSYRSLKDPQQVHAHGHLPASLCSRNSRTRQASDTKPRATCNYRGSWRRQWHPTPVLLPGKSHGWRSLEGCSPWGR